MTMVETEKFHKLQNKSKKVEFFLKQAASYIM